MIKILDLYAEWCAPCKAMGKILDNLKEEYPEIKIEKVDIDKEHDIVSTYNVRSIPYVVIFKEDEIIYQGSGIINKEKILNIITG